MRIFCSMKTKLNLSCFRHQIQKFSNSQTYQIRCSEKAVKRVQCTKLLGIQFDENLSLKDHANNVVKACYGNLQILRQFKRFAPLNVREILAKLSKIIILQCCVCTITKLPNKSFTADTKDSYRLRSKQIHTYDRCK